MKEALQSGEVSARARPITIPISPDSFPRIRQKVSLGP